MKNLFKVSLFTMGIVLSSGAMAATGIGHAQAELSNPLTVTNNLDINLGTVAIDPAAGIQTVSIESGGSLTCPPTYVCSGTPTAGSILITGAPNGSVNISIIGSTATLNDGSANDLTFDPEFNLGADTLTAVSLDGAGSLTVPVGGSIQFDGTEVAGTYTSQNGTGYTVTVNY